MSDELDISAALGNKTPVKNTRKRKSTSKEESGEESPEKTEFPSVFGAIGTPMAKVENAKEWDEWKEKELEKERRKWKRYLRSKWDLEQDKLPKKSDSKHYLGRHDHYANIKKAREEVADGLDAIHEMNFNVGKGAAINIQVNGKEIPKKKTKKFAAAVEKALAEMGNPSINEMWTDDMDEEEKRAEAEWARKRAKKVKALREIDADIQEFEENDRGRLFVPWDEYCREQEEKGKADKIGENHYKKWLEKKMDENKVSSKFNAYQLDLICLDEDAFKDKKSLKSVVKGVQNFYRKMRGPKKD
ncbi:CRE-SPE-11 protein [Caenorhabditis remanei]|uniref:CRE-SPE-11 protein n=1 Tax=Caenorhabditis remanei TaxID=31234 RepID=E3LVH9_CAERE|nr:CRE-SPE-11 protein [Caenorhabditis remanei]